MPAVFFDLDDTLYDFARATHEELLLRLDRLLGEGDAGRLPEAAAAYDEIREATWQEYLQGVIPFLEVRVVRFQRVLQALGLDRPAAQVQAEADAFIDGWMQRIQPFPAVVPLLDALQDRAVMGVITNGEPRQSRTKLEILGLAGRFRPDLVIASQEIGIAKPDPAIFALARSRAGAEAGETFMVGDSLEADVRGSLAAGWAGAVWLNRHDRPLPEDLGATQRLAVARDFTAVHAEVRRLVAGI